ncbi:hypothetical protein BGW36DRAFT_417589 [Talaromyces proteolyticus]|uniref:Zn(2)-C6 fungal-type domain-containing protein n=1 Tax=Talaromyces proteolyticus TaxID=1131652 RepID=A0AAD4PZX7_9EURO|nr:uncharacterized protein BGW36DRAFT_417589 [Talaromyces proteolyticus]KAH8696426.1 hypothetical protein BGW36DRAFT_417589 [Talaromyces proteolyticus]
MARTSEQQSRRKRSRMACEPCRDRKKRCNGGIPCSTCNIYGYKCYYQKLTRSKRSVSALRSTSAQVSPNIPTSQGAPTNEIDNCAFAESLEANSGAAFVRKAGLKIDPINAPKRNLFGWNVGTRQLPSNVAAVSPLSIVDIVFLDDIKALSNVYFTKVDPFYGFIDVSVFSVRLEARWQPRLNGDVHDAVLAGVGALGSLFSQRRINNTEAQLVELARYILDVHVDYGTPSAELVTAWVLRVIYLRLTARPYPTWIASCTLMHLIEAHHFHQDTTNTDSLPIPTVTDTQIRNRLVGVARHLNLWISYDLGVSRVSLANGPSTILPSGTSNDSTVEILNLLPISTCLGPEATCDDRKIQGLLLQTLKGTHIQPPSVLAQCNLVLCLLRRLHMTNITSSWKTIELVLDLFGRSLRAVRSLVSNCCPWHHVANVPFNMISILLEMENSEALTLLSQAMDTLKFVVSIYDTETIKEAYSTAYMLILLYQRRRHEDAELILNKVLQIHNLLPEHESPVQISTSCPEEQPWLQSLLPVADVSGLLGVNLFQFVPEDLERHQENATMAHPLQLAGNLARAYPWVSAPFIVSAPMRVMSGPALALAVSRAGGLGFLGPTIKTVDMVADLEKVAATIESSRASSTSASHTSSESNSSFSTAPFLPVGVGFQLWSDDIETAIGAIKKYKPCAAWLYAPREGQEDIDEWSRRIRSASSHTQIWVQIGTLKEARSLIQSSERPDVIVVQGSEAGGHGRAKDGLGLMALFPEVADVLASSQIPIFAAGGIADGRGAAAALCLGASGVVMGTRFLATSEARISRGYQNEILRASDGAVTTTRTLLYNHLRGTMGWPKEYSPRTIINQSFIEHQAGRPFGELKERHDQALKAGDNGWGPEGRLATYAGAAIGLIREVKDADSIVHEVRQDIQRRLLFYQQAKPKDSQTKKGKSGIN